MEKIDLKLNNPNQPTVKQHFVPQFYLNNFVNTEEKVEVLDCKNRRILTAKSTSSICYSKYFYAVETGRPDVISQYIEDAFQQMELSISKNMDFLIAKFSGVDHIEDNEKWLVSLLMSMLWLRNPALRKQINEMQEDVLKQIYRQQIHMNDNSILFDKYEKDTGNVASPEFRQEYVEFMKSGNYDLKFNNISHLELLETIPNFANMFNAQSWKVYINQTDIPFLTSDNPLVETKPDKPETFFGFHIMERIHYFSLSPSICIVATEPKKDVQKLVKRKTLYKKDSDRDTVLFLNMKLSGLSNNFAYSKDRNSFEQILEYLENRKSKG